MEETAMSLKHQGWSEDAIRQHLRGTVLDCGDFPTCSAVEDAIRTANEELPKRIAEYKKQYIDYMVSLGMDKGLASEDCEGTLENLEFDDLDFKHPEWDAQESLSYWTD